MADYKVQKATLPGYSDGGAQPASLDPLGNIINTPIIWDLLRRGRVFVAGDADENDRVTGQNSYVATTPTFLLDVKAGTIAIPLWVHMSQAGTVAGDPIAVYMSFDRAARYSSGGTSEAITSMHTGRLQSQTSLLYSGATAAAATEARLLKSQLLDQDVTDPNTTESIHWEAFRNFIPPFLQGPAALLVFSYAATTGPTWEWSIGWAEIPTANLN